MNFIRPEARAVLWRWREALVGAAALCVMALWAAGSFGIFRILALILAALCTMLIIAGLQRGRFRGRGIGQGVVQVDERQITYFGPLSGGSMALAEIGALSLNKVSTPPHWQLVPLQGDALEIPVNAQGFDALFDAFSGLPGLRTERLLHALNHGVNVQIVIWRRPGVHDRARALH